MEGLPKLPLLSFELKKSTDTTNLATQLKQYIVETYHEDPESYSNEIYKIEWHRQAAIRPTIDNAGLKVVKQYYSQLIALQSRFPMAKGQPAAANFTWKDLYDKITCTLPDIRFEMACVLYNIGALHTILGAAEPRTSADSLKAACTHYQTAAWVFKYLRENYPQPAGVDLSVDVLKFMQEICFAQAQECIMEKSIADDKKARVIGAVGRQVLLYYESAENLLGPPNGTDTVYDTITSKTYNYYVSYLKFKTAYIHCVINIYSGINADENKKFGERVAYFKVAAKSLSTTVAMTKSFTSHEVYKEAMAFLSDVVEAKLSNAEKENEFIYHEAVPEKDLLELPMPACLVKPIPINFNDPENQCDYLKRLIPIGAHEASSMYSEAKAKLLRQVISMADSKNAELSEFMSSLQLDHLDYVDSSNNSKLPQELVDRCAAMNAKSEIIQVLTDSMNSLAEIISNVESSLSDVQALIQQETSKEKEYQKVIGPRPPSIVCTDLSREASKYQEAHKKTTESNQVLHKAMMLHLANLRLLALPLDELEQRIPSLDKIDGLDLEAVSEMKRVLNKCNEMQEQREALLQQLREAMNNDDITSVLLTRANDTLGEIFQQEIEKHTPQVKIIEQNICAQENIINKLTSVYASYGESRRLLTDIVRKRESLINALITSYDTHEDLLSKSQKGLEFYRKLQNSVTQLLARVKSACQVQEEERTQLLSKQNKAHIPKGNTPTPAAPSPPIPEGNTPKLKDYLPYMKSRMANRTATPVPIAEIAPDMTYSETAYPTSIRPAPLGSETNTDPPPNYYDGYSQLPQNPYATNQQYSYNQTNPYSTKNQTYTASYESEKAAVRPEIHSNNPNLGYDANPGYMQQQYSSGAGNVQDHIYNNQYTGVQDIPTNATGVYAGGYVTENYPYSHNPYHQQGVVGYNQPDGQTNVPGYQNTAQAVQHTLPEAKQNPVQDPYTAENNQNVLNVYMANLQLQQHTSQSVAPATSEQNYPTDYSNPYYNHPQNNPAYSNPQSVTTPTHEGYNQNPTQYPYGQVQQSYAESIASRESVNSTPSQYAYPNQTDVNTTAYMNYNQTPVYNDAPYQTNMTVNNVSTNPQTPVNPVDQIYAYSQQPAQDIDPNNIYNTQAPQYNTDTQNYASYQNHPGYSYNTATGAYDYSYGYQSTTTTGDLNAQNQSSNAGTYETTQSPSAYQDNNVVNQNTTHYYNTPYGYQTVANVNQQGYTSEPTAQVAQTNYGADSNQATYINSANAENSMSSTYTNNSDQPKISVTHEEVPANEQNHKKQVESAEPPKVEPEVEEPTTIDLLSGLDFNIETKPLSPEIKVPPISEQQVRKVATKTDSTKAIDVIDTVIERPLKKNLFSDAGLLNKFTQEVQSLQKMVDGLNNKIPSGLTLIDSKWRNLVDRQIKEYSKKTKNVASENCKGNVVTEVLPYDDSRVVLKAYSSAYLNASYYKDLADWCIPLVISNLPTESEALWFYTSLLEYKIKCVVCLVSEIELQGSAYWPTLKGLSLKLDEVTVTLSEITCNVHWTERLLTVTKGKNTLQVSHYQINVYPSKVICSPLVLLADKVLSQTYENKSANDLVTCLVQCSSGGGRSALFSLLLAAMCQIRAGQIHLSHMLDSCCNKLLERRYNVIEETKYLADAYITVLYFAQGVLCSGATSFNGEAVIIQRSASIPTPLPQSTATSKDKLHKFSKESFEEMKQTAGLKTGEMNDPLSFLDPLWSLKKK